MTTVETTLKERGNRYGDFTDHALLAQQLQDSMRTAGHKFFGEGWNRLTSVQKQALSVIADKIARILTGDPNYADNWHDIQGYAKLVEDRLVTPEKDSPVYDTQPVQGQLFTDAFSAAAAAVSPRYYKPRCGSAAAYPEAKEQSIKASPPCVCY